MINNSFYNEKGKSISVQSDKITENKQVYVNCIVDSAEPLEDAIEALTNINERLETYLRCNYKK